MGSFEQQLYAGLVAAGVGAAAAAFVVLFFITAPYGRHIRAGWGPTVHSSAGWLAMESPAVLVFAVCFFAGNRFAVHGTLVFLLLWQLHYTHRAFIYPFRMRNFGKRMPLTVVLMAVAFNVFNGYLNGRYLGAHADRYPAEWFYDPRFLFGTALFFVGFMVNVHSDQVLFRLRSGGGQGYRIPYGGLYRWVSCPNYLGELLEWFGWALATWSVPGLVFAVWTAANLVPRARANHRWYVERFDDYPKNRKAVIPALF